MGNICLKTTENESPLYYEYPRLTKIKSQENFTKSYFYRPGCTKFCYQNGTWVKLKKIPFGE